VLLAGYTGRDRVAVQRHIDELAEQGIPPPPEVPVVYPGAELQVDGELPASIGWSSGEVEFVLLVTRSGTFVGVGSDHTDRELERTDMIPAKQAFPKIVGGTVWPLETLLPFWDELVLDSWLSRGQRRRQYQEGPLAEILRPEDLLNLINPGMRGPGLALFSGTVPALRPPPRTGHWRFQGELVTADGRALSRCQYEYRAGPVRAHGEME
jgi:hypothetical protein